MVRLPLSCSLQPADCSSTEPCPTNPFASRRVLIVDDNRDAAESTGMLLEMLGADVHVVLNGTDALRALPTYKPAIVLLDIGMPNVDGYEVARQIRQQPEFQDVTLIALTGWGQADDRSRSRSAGFDHHLIKPADVNALRNLFVAIEGSRHARR